MHKISIVPRGSALGYTLNLPEEDRYLKTREELIDHMTVLLAGRVAEELVFGAVTTGAANDLHRVAEISRAMIHDYAMGTSITSRKISAHGGEVSDRTRELRDDEQQHLADEARRAAAQAARPSTASSSTSWPGELLRNEVLERGDIDRIMAGTRALPARRRRAARRRRRPGSAARDERVGVRLGGQPLEPAACGSRRRRCTPCPSGTRSSSTWPRWCSTPRCSAIVWRLSPQARRASPSREPAGMTVDVEDAVGRVGGADARAAAEGAR